MLQAHLNGQQYYYIAYKGTSYIRGFTVSTKMVALYGEHYIMTAISHTANHYQLFERCSEFDLVKANIEVECDGAKFSWGPRLLKFIIAVQYTCI